MPLSTGIKTQRSAVVLLSGVTFEHNPNNIDGQQQVREGGVTIEATDSSTIYIKEQIVFNLNADKWFRAANNSNITWLADFDIIVSNQASDAAVIAFDLYRNSTIDLKAGADFGRFDNNSTLTLTQLLSGTKIDTSSSLYINNDLETEVKKDTTDVKGSLNNIFYSAGEPYVEISFTGNLPTSSTDSIAIGQTVNADGKSYFIGRDIYNEYGSSNIAIGEEINFGTDDDNDTLSSTNCIAIGRIINNGFNQDVDEAISIGNKSVSDGNRAISIGKSASVFGNDSILIGSNSYASGQKNIALGDQANITNGDTTSANKCIAIGSGSYIASSIDSNESIAIGSNSLVDANNSIAIGKNSKIKDESEYYFSDNAIAIGNNAVCNQAQGSIAIGWNADIGTGSNSTLPGAISIGQDSSVDIGDSIAIGSGAVVEGALHSVQLGAGTNTTFSTLQYRDRTLANEEGIQVKSGSGAPTSTPADGTLYVDTTGLKLYFRAGGQWIAAN